MNYTTILDSAISLFKDEPNNLSLLSNASAFIKQNISDLNWVGFYLFDGNNLTLGPFQGKVACNVIAPGKGVVGTGYLKKETIVVDDVSKIDNHIYCDAASQSEIVIPIFKENAVFALFDIDSPVIGRFNPEITHFLKEFTTILQSFIDFNKGLI